MLLVQRLDAMSLVGLDLARQRNVSRATKSCRRAVRVLLVFSSKENERMSDFSEAGAPPTSCDPPAAAWEAALPVGGETPPLPAPPSDARAARLEKFRREQRIVDCLNRGVSVAEIAARIGVGEKRMRAIIREILARRQPHPPEEFLAIQVSRLNEALLVAYSAMSDMNLKAVDRVVKIVRELDRYHGFSAPREGARQRTSKDASLSTGFSRLGRRDAAPTVGVGMFREALLVRPGFPVQGLGETGVTPGTALAAEAAAPRAARERNDSPGGLSTNSFDMSSSEDPPTPEVDPRVRADEAAAAPVGGGRPENPPQDLEKTEYAPAPAEAPDAFPDRVGSPSKDAPVHSGVAASSNDIRQDEDDRLAVPAGPAATARRLCRKPLKGRDSRPEGPGAGGDARTRLRTRRVAGVHRSDRRPASRSAACRRTAWRSAEGRGSCARAARLREPGAGVPRPGGRGTGGTSRPRPALPRVSARIERRFQEGPRSRPKAGEREKGQRQKARSGDRRRRRVGWAPCAAGSLIRRMPGAPNTGIICVEKEAAAEQGNGIHARICTDRTRIACHVGDREGERIQLIGSVVMEGDEVRRANGVAQIVAALHFQLGFRRSDAIGTGPGEVEFLELRGARRLGARDGERGKCQANC